VSHIQNTTPGFSGGGLTKHVTILNEATSMTIVHEIGSESVVVQCFTTDRRRVEPRLYKILDDDSVYLEFSIPQSGTCVIIG
jgi:hypothetical protein